VKACPEKAIKLQKRQDGLLGSDPTSVQSRAVPARKPNQIGEMV
jgi:hypothetical protein